MKRLFLTICTLSLFFTACENDSQKDHNRKNACAMGKTLRMNILIEPQTLDPRKAHTTTDINLAKMFMEGLTRVAKSGKVELALAERHTVSDDLKTYRFTLRKARWSNGEPVTAHDFVYSWKQTLSPKFPSTMAHQLFVVKNAKGVKSGNLPSSMLGIKALDDRTLIINLESPTPYFLDLLAFPTFFPVNREIDSKDPEWARNCSKFVCNGPFIPGTWHQSDIIEARKNAAYWDANQVKLGSVEMVVVTPDTALNMFYNNELDWSGSPFSSIPQDAIKALAGSKKIHSEPALGTFMIRANVNKPALQSAKVRKALALAINRKLLVEHVVQGGQHPATGFVPGSMGLKSDGYFADGNVEQARTLFNEALEEGVVSLQDFYDLTLLHVGGDLAPRVCQAVQQQWREVLGVEVRLRAIEPKVYFDLLSRQEYDLASGSWIADFSDPINFLNVFKTRTNGTNNTNWENTKYISNLDASMRTKSQETRKALLQESEQILMDEMPVIPLYHYNMLYVKKDNVKDVILSNMGTMDLKWANIE
jgi:oligopeptide transport system substrate-binding protein